MVLSKNISRCKLSVTSRRFSNGPRHYHSGDSSELTPKLATDNIMLSQRKLTTGVMNYLTKFATSDEIKNSLKLKNDVVNFFQKMESSISLNLENWTRVSSSISKSVKEQSTKAAGPFVNIHLNTKSYSNMISTNSQWQNKVSSVSKESICSRSCQILTSLQCTTSNVLIIKRLEELKSHIDKYPQAKHISVKEGAIPTLLNIKQNNSDQELSGILNEMLALLGYSKPVSGQGVRILSIDGGGIRGIATINMLKKLEEISKTKIHEMFDLICGVSTGAIIASLITTKQYSLDEILDIYKSISTNIFTQSALKGTSNLVWSHAYYDTALWEKLLKDQIGDQSLLSTARNPKCPKLCILSAVVNQSRLSAYVFRNYNLPCNVQSQHLGGYKHLIWQAVRASAAAPTYFEEFKLGNMLHQDGGILFNNPASVAIHEAKLLWPQTPIQCVVSFGNGRTVLIPEEYDSSKESVNSSWKQKFFAMIESATDTEGTHSILSDLLPDNVYFRFNPYLSEMLDIAEIDNKKLEQLERDVVMYLRRNEDKFCQAAHVLSQKKTVYQKTSEWFSLQKEIYRI